MPDDLPCFFAPGEESDLDPAELDDRLPGLDFFLIVCTIEILAGIGACAAAIWIINLLGSRGWL